MPLLKIHTNLSLSAEQKHDLLERGSRIVAEHLKKPIPYIEVLVQDEGALLFAGTTDDAAFVELRSLGFPAAQAKSLSAAICELLKTETGIPPERVFINFFDIPRDLWGWNGDTFG